jgi:flagellar export protein FliJ
VKGLAGVIRLNKFKLDEARRQLAALETLADDFRRQIAALDEELRREADVARESEEGGRLYAAFLTAARGRRQRLDNSLAEVTRQIGEAHARVTNSYQELKRYQLALEAREKQQAERVRRADQIRTDEIGLNLFRRRG